MSVESITSGMPAPLRADAGRFFLPGASEFADGLRLGEIIKGKVLRQYEGNRYLVNFDGHERVVDSNVPLQTGELIRGRVIALAERVELQRVHASEDDPLPQQDVRAQDSARVAGGRALGRDAILDRLMSQYNIRLSEADSQALKSALQGARDGNAMALAGALINKLGFTQTAELLWPVYNALLRRDPAQSAAMPANGTFVLDAMTGLAVALQPAVIRQIADAIDRVMTHETDRRDAEPQPSDNAVNGAAMPTPPPVKQISDEENERARNQEQLAYWLLNAQGSGTVAHRIGTLPLLLGGRLVEVEMSFFEQHHDAEQKPEAKHRKIVFALQMENLGRVEVMTRLSGGHASIQLAMQDESKTEVVAAYAEQLKSLLHGLGWTVDEVTYQTQHTEAYNGVVQSVVEHVVSQDSLNRLI